MLHAVVREHLEPFLRDVSDRTGGTSLPRFVEHEFRDFLGCGVLAEGFTRLRCPDCAFERLVPFSCKRRGFCPSCGGRRMAVHAASLVNLFTLLAYASGLRVTSSFVIAGTSTTLVLLVGFLVLREPFTWRKLVAVALIAAGTVLLQRADA